MAMDDRDIAHTIFRRNKPPQNQLIYRRLRNRVCTLVCSSKQIFWKGKLTTYQSSKRLRCNINELGLSNIIL